MNMRNQIEVRNMIESVGDTIIKDRVNRGFYPFLISEKSHGLSMFFGL